MTRRRRTFILSKALCRDWSITVLRFHVGHAIPSLAEGRQVPCYTQNGRSMSECGKRFWCKGQGPGRVKVRGLTLLETMLALIMLSLLIVGVLGLLGTLLVASTKSTDNTAATFVAQYLLDSAEGAPAPAEGVREGVEKLHSHEENHPVDFRYRMTWTLLAAATRYGGGSSRVQFGSDMYRVEVTVYWMVGDPDEGRAEGGGLRKVTMERIISCEPES